MQYTYEEWTECASTFLGDPGGRSRLIAVGAAKVIGLTVAVHLTDTLSRLIGVAPRELRRALAGADGGWVRRFLEARVTPAY